MIVLKWSGVVLLRIYAPKNEAEIVIVRFANKVEETFSLSAIRFEALQTRWRRKQIINCVINSSIYKKNIRQRYLFASFNLLEQIRREFFFLDIVLLVIFFFRCGISKGKKYFDKRWK